MTRARLASYQEHQARHGFSKWMIVERATGLPVGDSGLLLLDATGNINPFDQYGVLTYTNVYNPALQQEYFRFIELR